MKPAKLITGVIMTGVMLVCIALPSAIHGDVRFASGKSALAIPFELDDSNIDNHIFLRVSVNSSLPLSFILDTGASHTVLSLRHAESFGMRLQLIGKVDGGVGSEPPDVYAVTDKVSLNLPGVLLSDRTLVAIPLEMAQDCIGRSSDRETGSRAPTGETAKQRPKRVVDGILGADFFRSFVVEIDYAAQLINLYDPYSYEYSGRGTVLPLDMDPGHIFVRAQVKPAGRPTVTARLVVDTGSGTSLSLLKGFAEVHKLLPPASKLTTFTDCGIGGSTREPTWVGTLEALQLGGLKVSNPTTVFYQVAPAPGDGLLGNPVLRNFKVIFDYSRSRMILEPLRQK